MMHYDVLVIGAGLSGLASASLLAKRGLKVAVVESNYHPGGSCGTFVREGTKFDIGAAMLYGFGERGFNAHRFLFNSIEEEITMIRHKELYAVNFDGKRIIFYPDIDRFVAQLSEIFPSEKTALKKFYGDMGTMYRHIMMDNPTYASTDELDKKNSAKGMMKHPLSFIRFVGLLNISAYKLLKRYFKDPAIFKFFDKLTSTYCYTTTKETPAVLAAVMFVDNHFGGSYYPAGSTQMLPGKMEKSIEEHGGTFFYGATVSQIYVKDGVAKGVYLGQGKLIEADDVIFTGTVWNLYQHLLPKEVVKKKKLRLVNSLVPTYPSGVLYTLVDKKVIPEDTLPIEMLVGSPDRIDDSEVTAYILSIDDKTLCPPGYHSVTAIGPSFVKWNTTDKKVYLEQKEAEKERLLGVLEKRFPGFKDHVRFAELATPLTIERYLHKNGGAVAGPKQMIGQHMLKRQHIRTDIAHLYCAGESTVMGTGTPTVTVSGISAANAILKDRGMEPFVYHPNQKNFVRIIEPPFIMKDLYSEASPLEKKIMLKARRCRDCEHPTCMAMTRLDIRGINRRIAAGNFVGAKQCLDEYLKQNGDFIGEDFEKRCIEKLENGTPVAITDIMSFLREYDHGSKTDA